MNVLIVATLALGLVVDQHWAIWGQVAVSAVVWLLFRQVWHRSDESRRLPLVACLVFATFGEMFLSLVWGLYQYRLGNIPLFVPPGHVLLFYLGMQIAARLPARATTWIAALAIALTTVLAFSETLWVWADAVMDIVGAAHREIELEQAREEQQRRDAFLLALLTGTLDAAELRRDSGTFGLDAYMEVKQININLVPQRIGWFSGLN